MVYFLNRIVLVPREIGIFGKLGCVDVGVELSTDTLTFICLNCISPCKIHYNLPLSSLMQSCITKERPETCSCLGHTFSDWTHD